MADYFTQFSCQLDVGSAANAAQALAISKQLALELADAEGVGPGFQVNAEDKGVLWIHDVGAYGEPEHVIAFVLRCAQAFDLTGRWGFCWALTCSRPRTDSFGGGAQVIDLTARRSLDWIDCEHWVSQVSASGSLRDASPSVRRGADGALAG